MNSLPKRGDAPEAGGGRRSGQTRQGQPRAGQPHRNATLNRLCCKGFGCTDRARWAAGHRRRRGVAVVVARRVRWCGCQRQAAGPPADGAVGDRPGPAGLRGLAGPRSDAERQRRLQDVPGGHGIPAPTSGRKASADSWTTSTPRRCPRPEVLHGREFRHAAWVTCIGPMVWCKPDLFSLVQRVRAGSRRRQRQRERTARSRGTEGPFRRRRAS
jgi:hypothetical protein